MLMHGNTREMVGTFSSGPFIIGIKPHCHDCTWHAAVALNVGKEV